ncbi:hypothetical protein D9M72_302220 [compost metagenome]
MATEQRQQGLAPGGLLLQGTGIGLQQPMEIGEHPHQIGIVVNATDEDRHSRQRQFEFFQGAAHLGDIGIEHPVAPAVVVPLGAGMHLIRVDQRQTAGTGQVIDATIAVALSARLHHGDHIAVVHMGREAMFDIARRQQLQAIQMARLPEMRVFPLPAHGYALNSASRRCFTSGQSRSVML